MTKQQTPERVKFLRWIDGKGTCLDRGTILRTTPPTTRGGVARLVILSQDGSEHEKQDHPDFVAREKDWLTP